MLSHLCSLVCADAQVRPRFSGAQQNEACLAIFGEVGSRIGLVDFSAIVFSAVIQSSRACQAIPLMAQRWQVNIGGEGCVPNMLVGSYCDRSLAIGHQQSHFECFLF